jgi:tetratricopeptide (TPR) repeat protein
MILVRACLFGLLGLMLAANVFARDDGRAAMLDTLFTKLQATTDPSAAQALEQAIWEQRTIPAHPGQRELMMRGIAEMQQRELDSARATFTRLIERAPELSEAWNKRATVEWLLGDLPASIADICETVRREPRHFGAYSGLGMIRAQMDEPARAVAAFELARKYNPHIVGIDAEIARLKALGGDVPADPLGCDERTASR